MIAAKQEEILWVLDFIAEEQEYGLERLLASVYVVSEEQVVALRRKAAHLEQTNEIRILSMYISYYLDWR